jgi:hypothetical protein
MELRWLISASDVRHVITLLEEQQGNTFVRVRMKRNLSPRAPVTRGEVWMSLLSARLSSAQRSGPDSAISRFLRVRPFPLDYEVVRTSRSPADVIASALRGAGGIRFWQRIGDDMAANLDRLESTFWPTLLDACNGLIGRDDRGAEIAAADVVATLMGFGSKQSRNVLQQLGLTKSEIPIDSRLVDWLNVHGFPVRLTAQSLGDPAYYGFVMDGVVALCAAANVSPCVFDAAVFSAVDGDQWTADNATN